MWESNPTIPRLQGIIGFEDRESHQAALYSRSDSLNLKDSGIVFKKKIKYITDKPSERTVADIKFFK